MRDAPAPGARESVPRYLASAGPPPLHASSSSGLASTIGEPRPASGTKSRRSPAPRLTARTFRIGTGSSARTIFHPAR